MENSYTEHLTMKGDLLFMYTLQDYANAHGAPVEAFINAGYKEVQKNGLSALEYPTDGGARYRMLEGGSKYTNVVGNKSVWYKLDEAIAIAVETRMPLIITNGEASVVAAQ